MILHLSWNYRGHHLSRPCLYCEPPRIFVTNCALGKKGHRFLTSLVATSAPDDTSVSNRLIRKFVQSSSKSVALNTLSYLLSPDSLHPHLSSLAFPLYLRITEEPWFSWNSKMVANLIALLDSVGERDKAESLISETVSRLGLRERELALFYCNLIESHSKHKSKPGFSNSYARLKELMRASSSIFVKRHAFKSMVGGLCAMDLPCEADNLIEKMRGFQVKPSVFEFRSVIYAHGRLGQFDEMKRSVAEMEMEGIALDSVCSNMVLSSFGAHGELSEMVLWLQKMKSLGVPFSVRTYNSVLNSCPTMMAMLEDLNTAPISIQKLVGKLVGDEGLLVQELIGSSVLEEAMEWNYKEGKLDLHGMHLGSAYLIMLQWIEEVRSRFSDRKQLIPAEITIVCGLGKHSTIRGESPVKGLVKQMLIRTRFPMRIDRLNAGCFIAKGCVLKMWLGLG
ncbi:hypothetical protein NMG60_11019391 [Bertholletia excelsa]